MTLVKIIDHSCRGLGFGSRYSDNGSQLSRTPVLGDPRTPILGDPMPFFASSSTGFIHGAHINMQANHSCTPIIKLLNLKKQKTKKTLTTNWQFLRLNKEVATVHQGLWETRVTPWTCPILLSCKGCVTSSSVGATLKLLTMVLALTPVLKWAFLSRAENLSWMDYPCHWH